LIANRYFRYIKAALVSLWILRSAVADEVVAMADRVRYGLGSVFTIYD